MAPKGSSQAILYAAKSTEDKRGSIPGQLGEGRAFAQEEGLEVVAEYSEQDVSAYSGNRGPELAAALKHAEKIKGVLIAQHSDRLARGDGRQARHLVEIALWARRTGVEIRCIQDPSTFENIVLAAVMGERNMEDSRRKSAAVAAGVARRRSSGLPVGGSSFGFTWTRNEDDVRELVPDPRAAKVVKRIYTEYLAGRTQFQIARALTADGIPTARGGKWKPTTVRRILMNPLHAGMIRDGERLIDGRHKAIISRRTWEDAQAQRGPEKRVSRPGRPTIGRHLFRNGVLRCGECGDAMIVRCERTKDGGFYETYRCHGHYLDPARCSMVPQRREPIDSAVYAYFEQAGLDAQATSLQLSKAVERRAVEVRKLLDDAKAEAEAAVARLARVKGHFTGGELTVAEWRTFQADLEPEALAAAAERDRLVDQLATVEAAPDVSAAESELRVQLARISAAVNAGVVDEANIHAVRVAFLQLFDNFVIHRRDADHAGLDLLADGYWIEPVTSERSVQGYEEKLRPVLVKKAPASKPKNDGKSATAGDS